VRQKLNFILHVCHSHRKNNRNISCLHL